MSATKIEWAEATWNPVTGCTKISHGCQNCYAERMARRQKAMGTKGYEDGFKVALHPDRLDEPLHWRKPRRIFVCSMGDLFHDDVPFEFISTVLERCLWSRDNGHTFIVLTKRPARMLEYSRWACDGGGTMLGDEAGMGHVWLGVTAEDQQRAYERIPLLLRTPAAVRFVSIEPMLGPMNVRCYLVPGECGSASGTCLDNTCRLPALDWVILGGESGPGARPMHPDWARSVRDQCAEAGVPFLFKQWGEHLPVYCDEFGNWCCDHSCGLPKWICEYPGAKRLSANQSGHIRVGKKLAGRLLDGKLHDEYPKDQSNG